MSEILKADKNAIAMELIPVTIQLLGIVAMLIAAYGNLQYSIAATFISLVWLKLSRSNMTDAYGDLRLRRALFIRIGNWLDRDDAGSEFDRAQSEILMIDGSLEDDQHRAVVTAAALANIVRGAGSVVIHVYLVFLTLSFFAGYFGA